MEHNIQTDMSYFFLMVTATLAISRQGTDERSVPFGVLRVGPTTPLTRADDADERRVDTIGCHLTIINISSDPSK
jgi:hypothetical protein